jgi:hypothetical protein
MKNALLNALAIFVLLATSFAIITCVRIEVLNKRAGFYLPRKDFPPPGSNPKWRAIITTETTWKMLNRPLKNDEFDLSPLTATEQTQLEQLNERERNKNRLRWLISTSGLLQYPVCVLILVSFFLTWVFSKQTFYRRSTLISASVAIICLGFAVYRNYAGSLGW